jgi:hypothetical protein
MVEVWGLLWEYQEAGKLAEFEALVKETETAKLEGGELDDACAKLQELVGAIRPSADVLKQAGVPALLS